MQWYLPHFGDQEVEVSSFLRVERRHRFCWSSDLPQFEIVPRHFRHQFAICPGKEQCRNGIGSSQFIQWEREYQDNQEWLLKSATIAAREETWRPAAGDTFRQLEPKPIFWSVSFPDPSAVYLCDLGWLHQGTFRCGMAAFCGPECQKKGWTEHRVDCRLHNSVLGHDNCKCQFNHCKTKLCENRYLRCKWLMTWPFLEPCFTVIDKCKMYIKTRLCVDLDNSQDKTCEVVDPRK